MDAPEVLSRRARRALPLMAGALAAIVVAGLVYLHPSFPPSAGPPAARSVPSAPMLASQYSATYDFVTPSTGWALVVDQSAQPANVYVYRTTDGAKRWQEQFAASAQPARSGIRFFDRNHGLIFFGFPAQLYRTSDAGNQWTLVGMPPDTATAITFTDPLHGWVLAQEPGEGFAKHFFTTTNGGSSWTEMPWPQWAVWGGQGGGIGSDLQFRRTNEGWLGASADQPTVYSTTDGGSSWQAHALPSLPKPNPATGGKPPPPPGSGFTFNTDVRLLPGAGVVAFVDLYAQGAAFTSFDDGKSWRALPPTPGETTYSDFAFQDSRHWWAMRFGTLWKSSDAGQSWKHVGQQIDEWDYRPHVVDARHAWAMLIGSRASGTGLAMTADAGLHWTYVKVPTPG